MGINRGCYAIIPVIGILAALGIGAPPQVNPPFCPYGSALSDGCIGAQGHGTIIDAHLADPKAVIDLNVDGGSGYTAGTYTWTSSGGGCTTNATGTVTVSAGGVLGGGTQGSPGGYTITNRGAGCTSRPTIAVPGGAGGGTGGAITPTVYQLTPHNASGTIGNNWNLPGVDYPVGYDTTLTLKDPTTASLPSGCTFLSPVVTCAGSGGTINGYDFTLHNTRLAITASGWTVSNNNFICAPRNTSTGGILTVTSAITSGTTIIKYNTFNGNDSFPSHVADNTNLCDSSTLGVMAQITQTDGTIIFEYNYCYQADSKCLNFTQPGSGTHTLNVTERFNYYADFGIAGTTHGEAQYAYPNNASDTINWTLQYNVAVVHYYAGPTNLTSPFAQQADAYTLATTTDHNYGLARGTQSYTGNANNNGQVASASIFLGAQNDPATGTISGTSSNNIWDYSGAFAAYNAGSTFGGIAGNVTDYNAGSGGTCQVSVSSVVTC